MTDNMKDVLQELSDLLNRISQQNQESLQRQQEFRSKMDGQESAIQDCGRSNSTGIKLN